AWDITTDVDKTHVKQIGGSVTFTYTVKVHHDAGTDGTWKVAGTINVSNINEFDVSGVDVTDALSDATTCTVTGGSSATIPANDDVDFAYTCSPSGNSSTSNTATVTWPDGGPSTALPA